MTFESVTSSISLNTQAARLLRNHLRTSIVERDQAVSYLEKELGKHVQQWIKGSSIWTQLQFIWAYITRSLSKKINHAIEFSLSQDVQLMAPTNTQLYKLAGSTHKIGNALINYQHMQAIKKSDEYAHLQSLQLNDTEIFSLFQAAEDHTQSKDLKKLSTYFKERRELLDFYRSGDLHSAPLLDIRTFDPSLALAESFLSPDELSELTSILTEEALLDQPSTTYNSSDDDVSTPRDSRRTSGASTPVPPSPKTSKVPLDDLAEEAVAVLRAQSEAFFAKTKIPLNLDALYESLYPTDEVIHNLRDLPKHLNTFQQAEAIRQFSDVSTALRWLSREYNMTREQVMIGIGQSKGADFIGKIENFYAAREKRLHALQSKIENLLTQEADTKTPPATLTHLVEPEMEPISYEGLHYASFKDYLILVADEDSRLLNILHHLMSAAPEKAIISSLKTRETTILEQTISKIDSSNFICTYSVEAKKSPDALVEEFTVTIPLVRKDGRWTIGSIELENF